MTDDPAVLENPPGFLVRTEIEQATHRQGWLLEKGVDGAWIVRASRHVPATVAIAGAPGGRGPWAFAIDHPGVVDEIGLVAADLPGPGIARYLLADGTALHEALGRAFDLALALPDQPLRRFQAAIRRLPRTTEAEVLVVQRRGQEIFRDSLMAYWKHRCPITGIDDDSLLRASHIKPWKDCETDAERLDPYNGLLLSALWDAAFDAGLVTFDDTGIALLSPGLSSFALGLLVQENPLNLTRRHQTWLAWHRDNVFVG